MKLRFWGVRGSIPVPGVGTSRYGGNTSCVEVQADGEAPLVLDCG
ncbi:MAG TPA: MBL fold metallo-hydrolase, partial [Myxococcota bacterium]|nr:MBL fold metallo-hydrolase [Myxococcota bacterium]